MKRIVVIFTFLLAMINLSCQRHADRALNPLVEEWTTPFGVPPFDEIKLEHYGPAFEEAMKQHEAEIEAITANGEEPTFENTILAFDRSGLLLERVSLVFGMLSAAETNAEMQQIEAEMMPLLAAHSDRIMLNEQLFDRIRAVYEQRAKLGLDAEQLRLVEETY